MNYTDEMLECVDKGLDFTLRTCESTLWHTHCTSEHQSCIIWLFLGQVGHRDLDHIIMNISTAAPRIELNKNNYQASIFETIRSMLYVK